jgi:ribose transport system permease protein
MGTNDITSKVGPGPDAGAARGPGNGGKGGGSRVQGHDRTGASVIQRYAGVFVLIGLIVLFSLIKPHLFLTYNNFVGIFGNSAIIGIIAVGLLMPLAAGVFDISIGGSMTLSIVAVTYLFQLTHGGMPVPVAILIVLLLAVVIGFVNSALVVREGIDPFIATIGTGAVLVGMSQLLGNGTTITNDIPSAFTDFGRWQLGKIPVGVFILAALCLLAWYVLDYTPLGRHIYATGAAREATRLTGIRTTRVITITFICSAMGAALAGIVFASRAGSGPPGIGAGYLLSAYSAAFLGSTIIRPGRFNVGGLVVALLIIGVGINGLQIAGLPFWVVETFQGVALLVAVLIGRKRPAVQ